MCDADAVAHLTLWSVAVPALRATVLPTVVTTVRWCWTCPDQSCETKTRHRRADHTLSVEKTHFGPL